LQHKYLPLQQEGKVNSWQVYFQVVPHRDEARFGLMTVQRRVLIGKGVKPIGAFQHRFIYRYVYGVVSPMDGDHFYITATHADTMMFNWFLEQLSAHKPEELKIIFLDRAGYHLAKDLKVADNILLWQLPPYCPELNGIERFWQEVKRHIAWHNFQTDQELEQWLEQELKTYKNETIASITGYHYIINAIDEALSYALP